ncbi:OLC1v1009530C2 [Oldenlandia corymbosa var. corymbosa]|uniref:OLC1v1009530C2 n=1 Tax=Oldenlandia corymbosa var. corymbosa TaxID=529605 RepID=A0AAV1DRK6_OLDCO|nr:OLC1v1009530C2 [Oldenlandia corymbosa var. corymbosa]
MKRKMVDGISDFRLSKCAKSERSLGDRISLLPSEILVHILSFLTLKEAGRTSVLSKRWMELWAFVVQLDFDASKVSSFGTPLFPEKRQQYVEWVEKVLESHKAPVIIKFRICFELNKYFQNLVDMWLHYAFSKRVERLEVDLLRVGHPLCPSPEPCHFPAGLLDQSSDKRSEESHYIDYGKSIHNVVITRFSCLRSLSLSGVVVTGVDFDLFLLKFPCLECLIVRSSHSQDMSAVTVSGSSLALRYLEITYCKYLQSIIVRDTCLVSLIITRVSNLQLENVPRLVNVRVSGWLVREIIPQLSSFLSRLEVLTLHFVDDDVREVSIYFYSIEIDF